MNTAYFIQQIEQQMKAQDSFYHNVAVSFGLSDSAMWVLYHVTETSEVLTQQDLCRQNFSAKQTIHTAINGLVKNGFVELIPIPGTRNHKKILLTAAGQVLADRTVNRLKEAEQRAYSKLSEAELQAYLELTTHLTNRLREETDKLIQEENTMPAAADSAERRSGNARADRFRCIPDAGWKRKSHADVRAAAKKSGLRRARRSRRLPGMPRKLR